MLIDAHWQAVPTRATMTMPKTTKDETVVSDFRIAPRSTPSVVKKPRDRILAEIAAIFRPRVISPPVIGCLQTVLEKLWKFPKNASKLESKGWVYLMLFWWFCQLGSRNSTCFVVKDSDWSNFTVWSITFTKFRYTEMSSDISKYRNV